LAAFPAGHFLATRAAFFAGFFAVFFPLDRTGAVFARRVRMIFAMKRIY
jgi:hypothetical protein